MGGSSTTPESSEGSISRTDIEVSHLSLHPLTAETTGTCP